MNYAPSTRNRIADLIAGIRVDRATAAMTDASIFTITGGNILLTLLLGEVTTILENIANNTKLTATPTVGTAVDICANLDTANIEVGGFLYITGTLANALAKSNAGASALQVTPIVVAPGVIAIDVAAAKSGSVKWSLWYVPLETGAYVTAA